MSSSIGGYKNTYLKKINQWNAMPSHERSVYVNMKIIKSKCALIKLDTYTSQDAVIYYCKLSDARHPSGKYEGKRFITRGAILKGFLGACIMRACSKNNKSRDKGEISKVFKIKEKSVSIGIKRFDKFKKIIQMTQRISSSKPEEFVKRYSKTLNMSQQNIDIGISIAENISRLGICSNHKPTSVAAAIISLVIRSENLNITNKRLSNHMRICENTITSTSDDIYRYVNILKDKLVVEKLIKYSNDVRAHEKIPEHLYKRLASF
jgi:transcription initiation factor TFIIIB Brf1 subunit/transcription initiation factor TFIIB